MESPQSIFSTPSAASSPYFSELASISSCSDENFFASNHILSLSPPSETYQELETYLRSLPLEQSNTRSYLLLGLGHDTENIFHGKSLDKLMSSMGDILGDRATFDATRCGIDFDKVIIPDTKVISKNQWLHRKMLTLSNSCVQLSPLDALNAFSAAGLHLVYSAPFTSPSRGTLYMLERAPFSFPPLLPKANSNAKEYNPYGPPSREEWRTLWSAWDAVTLGMIPPEMLHQKPIDLRHKCLFYIGHIPTCVHESLSAVCF